ncbi:mechanosensitive ion channel family protein [Aquamicrobium segne]|uniref:Mechanosensitive ion channel family protein n=1 Tax=Aquamicrobium segne TaxID=469547 RepID=A0ABW0H2U0_9HYPH
MDLFFQSHSWLSSFALLAVLVLAAFAANFLVKAVLLRVLKRILAKTAYGRDKELRRHSVIERLANIIPALLIAGGIAFVPDLPDAVVAIVRNVASAFIILTVALAIASAVNIIDTVYHRSPQGRLKPIKGYIQVAKIAIYILATILIIAVVTDRSPILLLSGLGAITAVLILIFQDTLLSLVAGIQISSTDMVRVGDWIEMPSLDVNGNILEIALHTVTVQNFDKTITTLPIRKLVTEPFKNWRGMQESGGRRIKRSLNLEQTSIRFLDQADLERLVSFAPLEEYLTNKCEELDEWNSRLGTRAQVPANTRRVTNIGTFRAYVDAYLRNHSRVHKNMTVMVRQLEPGPEGLPLELYCFANTIAWVEYEGIQADIFDHLLALLPEFGLSVFQNPSGTDIRSWSRTKPVDRTHVMN